MTASFTDRAAEAMGDALDAGVIGGTSDAKVIEMAKWHNRECARTVLPALLAFLEAEGFVIVPAEPTREMWAIGGNAVVGYKQRHHDQVVGAVWNGMLAAAPSPFEVK